MANRDHIVNTLRNGVCVVTFKKVNGDVRTLYGTLNEGLMPAEMVGTSPTTLTNENVVTCFDVENNGYRNFRLDSVIDYTGPSATLAEARKAWEAFSNKRV